ncbi:L,D-transpeptidase family protein [Verrucomicrobium sp. 3C]|uniref:L,D-transpeptidase family protein n=1 Tax=Verrucomicrobium sp. 3C TaxID=1134055 RepID=UPI0003616294|nr:L,D-transpeptidase family protein [Verrucomicrobium sp. 3C]
MSVPLAPHRRRAFHFVFLAGALQALPSLAPAAPPLLSAADPPGGVWLAQPEESVLPAQSVDPETLRKLEKQAEKEKARQEKEMRKAAERERKRLDKERQTQEKAMRGHPKPTSSSEPQVRVAIPVRPQAPPRVLPAIWSQLVPSKKITSLVIHVRQQKLYVYQGKKLAAIAPICTGNATHPTPMGRFTIIQKDRNHLSSRYGCFVDNVTGRIVDGNAILGQRPPPGTHYEAAEMPHFLRITSDGVGLHGGYLPGYAASHGCIRLPKSFASELFEFVPDGTPVSVVE